MFDLYIRKDGWEVCNEVVNPVTGEKTLHPQFIPNDKIPKPISLIGIVSTEIMKDGVVKIRLASILTDKIESLQSDYRSGTRKERIAKLLMDKSGKAYTAKELTEELTEKDKDQANVQWEAELLTRQDKRFKKIKKGRYFAYLFLG